MLIPPCNIDTILKNWGLKLSRWVVFQLTYMMFTSTPTMDTNNIVLVSISKLCKFRSLSVAKYKRNRVKIHIPIIDITAHRISKSKNPELEISNHFIYNRNNFYLPILLYPNVILLSAGWLDHFIPNIPIKNVILSVIKWAASLIKARLPAKYPPINSTI